MELDFRSQMAALGDQELLGVLRDPAAYVPEALDAARQEIAERGLELPESAAVVATDDVREATSAETPRAARGVRAFLGWLDIPAQFVVPFCGFGIAWSGLPDWSSWGARPGFALPGDAILLSLAFVLAWVFLHEASALSWQVTSMVYGWPLLAGLAVALGIPEHEDFLALSWPYITAGLAALAVLTINSQSESAEPRNPRLKRCPNRTTVVLAWVGFFLYSGAMMEMPLSIRAYPPWLYDAAGNAVTGLMIECAVLTVCYCAVRAGRALAWWVIVVLLGGLAYVYVRPYHGRHTAWMIGLLAFFGVQLVVLLYDHPWRWRRVPDSSAAAEVNEQ